MLDDTMIVSRRLRPALSLVRSSSDKRDRAAPPYMRLVHSVFPPDISLEFHDDLAEIEHEWRAFEKIARCTVFQTYHWLAKWQRHIGEPAGVRPAIVIGRNAEGEVLFLFPLAIETRGLFRRLAWLGSELCDYNAPLLSEQFLRDADASRFTALWRDILKLIRKTNRRRFDFVDLGRMPESVGAGANPFLALDVLAHPSGAHVAQLGEDWESFYAAKRSSATRKKERKKLRQLGEYGDVRLVGASTSEDRAAILTTLMQQKSQWFARMGVKDIFARPGRREFFMDVATDPAMRSVVQVSKLAVGSTDAATSVELKFGNCHYLVLSSYQEGELARLGPGRVHLQRLIQRAIEEGICSFDFTVGDEAYKRDWTDRQVNLYDYLAPVTIRGRLPVTAITAFRRIKRVIKTTPLLWHAYGAMRSLKARWLAGPRPQAEAE